MKVSPIATLRLTPKSEAKPTKQSSQVPAKQILATGIGVDIRSPSTLDSAIKENRPNDPMVPKKVLDALDIGLINFSQKERDTLADILMGQAEEVRQKMDL